MSLLDTLFGRKKSTASVAKDRLTIMLSHERASCKLPYLDDLRNDLIAVIKKYAKVFIRVRKNSGRRNRNYDRHPLLNLCRQ